MSFQSEAIISAASQRFGTIDYTRWQALRWQWYAWVTYPLLGASELNFFGNAVGQGATTLADTNLPKAGSFGQTHFLVKTISTGIKLGQNDLSSFTLANVGTADTRTLASDIIAGFTQAGVLTFSIGARPFATIPKPFMYAPPTGNEVDFDGTSVSQPSVAPLGNVVAQVPFASQTRNRANVYRVDPNILIEAEQQFEVKISFPSGSIPVLATGLTPAITDNNTNPLKVGVILDGVLLRPMQ
jgi:hypothetical protein